MAGGRGRDVALVQLGPQPAHLLAVADDLGRAPAAVALQAPPVVLQLAVALLAGEEEAEGVAERGGVAAQEGHVAFRVAAGAGRGLEVEHGQHRARPGVADRGAEHGVRPPAQRRGG